MSSVTEQSFLADVRNHVMTVEHDVGLHRHLQFRRPGTTCCGFDIVTWPGYLAFAGDMGSFVFSRLPDMLEFFRRGALGDQLRINLPYWSEKLQAVDRCSGFKQYSEAVFRERIADWLKEAEAGAALRASVQADILDQDCSDERTSRARVDEFEHDGFRFYDFWECGLDEYTPRFIWCCYALVWAIQQYDAAKAPAVASPPEAATC